MSLRFRPRRHLRTTLPHLLFAFACGFAPVLEAQAAELVSQFESTRGPVSHYESENGSAHLLLERANKRVPLPAAWRNTNIEHTMDLGSETAVVVSYSDSKCEARLALLVVTPAVVWGPYDLGGCNEMLAYQRSADGTAFVAIRADGSKPLAWTYSTVDQDFRGPAEVALPPSLAALTTTPAKPATAPKPAAPAPGKAPTATARPSAPPPPKPAPSPVPAAPSAPSPAPAPAPVFSPSEAGSVAEEVRRTTRAKRRVNIDLT